MNTQEDFNTWAELEIHVQSLAAKFLQAKAAGQGYYSSLLYRGQADAGWSLASTLQRSAPRVTSLSQYYRIVAVAKSQLESHTGNRWSDLDVLEVTAFLNSYDKLHIYPLPGYDYLVYLRHHGFPSPLLDWTRSLYVAAYFACHEPKSDRVAIYAYQEHAGEGKADSSLFPQIFTLGPNVRTHPRHFLQQAEYSIAVKFELNEWRMAAYSEVIGKTQENQDNMWKFTLPTTEAPKVLRRLDEYNINAYSLFQSEESLHTTLAWRLLQAV